MADVLRLTFDRGTILIAHAAGSGAWTGVEELPGVRWDDRVAAYRTPAWRYAEIRSRLEQRGMPFEDVVAAWDPRSEAGAGPPAPAIELRPYQEVALGAWRSASCRGLVVMPTGSGKTRLAVAAIARGGHRALCLVPTRVLLRQWASELERALGCGVGLLGDGERRVGAITVATYESAARLMPAIGNRFELLIVDEVHHFGAGGHDMALEMCCAAARLGLTATLALRPQAELRVCELIGPTVFFLSSHELSGTRHLAPFELVVIAVDLEPDERRRYVRDRSLFRGFHQTFARILPGASFEQFVRDASGSDAGREALAAWRRCRKLLAFPQAKARVLGDLLAQHRGARVLVFTADNETAYAIARAHLIMPITCDIPRREREAALEHFRAGGLRALVSARVLNEGLDVPDAEVAIIVGGTQGEREHVQRVGRLLRPAPGKCALVYELVVRRSSEVELSMRRSASLGPKTAAHLHRAR